MDQWEWDHGQRMVMVKLLNEVKVNNYETGTLLWCFFKLDNKNQRRKNFTLCLLVTRFRSTFRSYTPWKGGYRNRTLALNGLRLSIFHPSQQTYIITEKHCNFELLNIFFRFVAENKSTSSAMSTELAKWIFYKSAKIFGLVSVLLTSLVFFFFYIQK